MNNTVLSTASSLKCVIKTSILRNWSRKTHHPSDDFDKRPKMGLVRSYTQTYDRTSRPYGKLNTQRSYQVRTRVYGVGGPDEVRALVARDLVVVRLKGVLTPAERQLAKTAEGVEMVKRLRQNLIAQGRGKLCEQVGEITGAKILGLFTAIDVQLGERVFVFTVDRELQNGARWWTIGL